MDKFQEVYQICKKFVEHVNKHPNVKVKLEHDPDKDSDSIEIRKLEGDNPIDDRFIFQRHESKYSIEYGSDIEDGSDKDHPYNNSKKDNANSWLIIGQMTDEDVIEKTKEWLEKFKKFIGIKESIPFD